MTEEDTRAALEARLMENLPGSAVSKRQGGGQMLSYVDGFYVKDRLCQVFGPLGYDVQVTDLKMVADYMVNEKHRVNYTCLVTLYIHDMGISKQDVGFGQGIDKDLGKAHESATKEAVTDALKRAATHLGRSMGLALYDKQQRYVEGAVAKKPAAKKKPAKKAAKLPNPDAIRSAMGAVDTIVALEPHQKDIRLFREEDLATFNELVGVYNARKEAIVAQSAEKESKKS